MSTHSGGVRSRLEDVSLETVAQHPEHLHRTSLDGLPEDLALRLFEVSPLLLLPRAPPCQRHRPRSRSRCCCCCSARLRPVSSYSLANLALTRGPTRRCAAHPGAGAADTQAAGDI